MRPSIGDLAPGQVVLDDDVEEARIGAGSLLCRARMRRTRATARASSAGPSARITPWLPVSIGGFTTQGKPTSPAPPRLPPT